MTTATRHIPILFSADMIRAPSHHPSNPTAPSGKKSTAPNPGTSTPGSGSSNSTASIHNWSPALRPPSLRGRGRGWGRHPKHHPPLHHITPRRKPLQKPHHPIHPQRLTPPPVKIPLSRVQRPPFIAGQPRPDTRAHKIIKVAPRLAFIHFNHNFFCRKNNPL